MKVKNANYSSFKTKNSIKQAFFKLLDEKKDISKINVTDLVQEAGINRSTFYIHYSNLNDVATDIQESFFNAFIKTIDYQDYNVCIDSITAYFKENEDLFKKIGRTNFILSFSNSIKSNYIDQLREVLNKKLSYDKKYIYFLSYLFTDSLLSQYNNYFKEENYPFSLDEINNYTKIMCERYVKYNEKN